MARACLYPLVPSCHISIWSPLVYAGGPARHVVGPEQEKDKSLLGALPSELFCAFICCGWAIISHPAQITCCKRLFLYSRRMWQDGLLQTDHSVYRTPLKKTLFGFHWPTCLGIWKAVKKEQCLVSSGRPFTDLSACWIQESLIPSDTKWRSSFPECTVAIPPEKCMFLQKGLEWTTW